MNSHGTQQNVHSTGVFTQGGETCGDPDMSMHTCMCLLHILKLTSQISLTFGFGLFDKSSLFQQVQVFFRLADMLTETD